jgi:hypothetical protein
VKTTNSHICFMIIRNDHVIWLIVRNVLHWRLVVGIIYPTNPTNVRKFSCWEQEVTIITAIIPTANILCFQSVTASTENMNKLRSDIDNQLHSLSPHDLFVAKWDDVSNAVHRLKHGKHEGDVAFLSDFIIQAPDTLYVHFSLLIYAMINHGMILIILHSTCSSTILYRFRKEVNVAVTLITVVA